MVAFTIGAAFLAVFYTQTTNLYGRSEELWEGIFNLIAVLLITPMSLAILRADRSRVKWRRKLAKAFAGLSASKDGISSVSTGTTTQDSEIDATPTTTPSQAMTGSHEIELKSSDTQSNDDTDSNDKKVSTPTEESSGHILKSEKRMAIHEQNRGGIFHTLLTVIRRPFTGEAKGATAIFFIPFVTTLREGLEGVVFIGGVSLGLPATSIPLPAIVGIASGLLCGFIVFKAGSFSKVRIFLILSTCILLVIAAGMASRCVYYFTFYRYVLKVGDAAAESGSGPGSYDALNYVWHLNCCNPEDKTNNGGGGWAILNSLVGWNNTATVGTILAYIFYWLTIASYLIYSSYSEKRKSKKRRANVSM